MSKQPRLIPVLLLGAIALDAWVRFGLGRTGHRAGVAMPHVASPVGSRAGNNRPRSHLAAARPGESKGLSPGQHAAFAAWLAAEPGFRPNRPDLLAGLIADLSPATVAATVQSMTRDELRSAFGDAAVQLWLKTDAVAAAVWLAGSPDPTSDQAAMVAHAIGPSPASLAAYCDGLCSGSWQQEMLLGASLELSPKDPASALTFAQRLPAGPQRTNVLSSIAYDWAMADPVAAATWMGTVQDPALKERLLAAEAQAMATSDPDLAVAAALQGQTSPQSLATTLPDLIETWAAHAPAAAAGWVQAYPPGELRSAALEIIGRRWRQANPADAEVWISSLSPADRTAASL